jgi:hypothetical protein
MRPAWLSLGKPRERAPSGDNSVGRGDFSTIRLRISLRLSNGPIINFCVISLEPRSSKKWSPIMR